MLPGWSLYHRSIMATTGVFLPMILLIKSVGGSRRYSVSVSVMVWPHWNTGLHRLVKSFTGAFFVSVSYTHLSAVFFILTILSVNKVHSNPVIKSLLKGTYHFVSLLMYSLILAAFSSGVRLSSFMIGICPYRINWEKDFVSEMEIVPFAFRLSKNSAAKGSI